MPEKPITPQEALEQLEAEDAPVVDRVVAELNGKLRKGERNFQERSLGPNQRISEYVQSLFAKSGWRVDYQSDPREGGYYTFNSR